MPLFMRNRMINVSNTVIDTPHINGKPNSNFNPMAIPITSAKSQAAIAISANMYNGILIKLG
ncbi:hypothetical protein D3C87_1868700 [compost metagenome]